MCFMPWEWVMPRLFQRAVERPRVLGMFLAVLLVSSMVGFSPVPASSEPPTLPSVTQIRHIKADQSGKPVAVHVHAVVTYFDTVAPNLFVQDATGGVWVDLRGLHVAPPQPGQLLDLRGEVGSGFTPYIAKSEWKVIGHSPFPKPIRLSYEQAATGTYDSQWAEMEGIVRSFVLQAEGNVLVIDVATPTGTFKVRVPDYKAPFPLQLVH